ncbi:hypothetical protein BUALT_Bualt18G0098700 [Buddleja alternifolia]|uniref:Uncharacterized protein n=1 Tax=Buddleja alternifolia TaxID=168488 RepID=A0AAV6WEJ5_9LAMI|nr:hypothetical protein BUALT_Bualt18G0098700 [Buddleja alternifolia]
MEGVGGGGSSSNNSCNLMAFGEHNHNNNNNNGFCPVIMMPNNLFLPLSSTNNIVQDLNRHGGTGGGGGGGGGGGCSMMLEEVNLNNNNNNNSMSTGYYFMESNNDDGGSVKAKIMAHPHYNRLLAAYINCHKIGAPPEVVAKLEEACASAAAAMGRHHDTSCVGEDPALDQFMEAYCEMLRKYEQELSKPFEEAMIFLSRIDSQFKALTLDSACGEGMERNGSSEEELDVNNNFIDPQAEDLELKGRLLRKYSGYLGSLKQEFMKKRKKGKLPKEARQQLLEWWSSHYKWPYPSESQKLALAESTGLDQKQINNWFINQRKRHWKPTEDMQFMVMDHDHHHHQNYYNMDNVLGNHLPMDIAASSLNNYQSI